MRYRRTPRSRDRYKAGVAVATGLVTFSAVAATGAVSGWAARATGARDEARRQADAEARAQAYAAYRRAVQVAPESRLSVVTVTRPHRTVVRTNVVHRVSQAGVAQVSSGGGLSPVPVYSPSSAPQGGHVSTAGSGSVPAPAPAPPPPAPAPPAPSSGS